MNTENSFGISIRRVATGAASVALLALTFGSNGLRAQDTAAPGTPAAPTATPAEPAERTKAGFSIRETADLGGHISDIQGSGAMYDTLVNIHSGPRVLGQTFDLRALPDTKHTFFDSLSAFTTGFGGDPNNVATLRFSKGKGYDFRGQFRRDRQYFDYNLLGNPLVPAGVVSNGYTFPQLIDSPHMFNTVRRMTDVNVTIFPISKFTFRAGYSQNLAQGPTLSSVHEGADGLLLQNWRHSTDDYLIGADWKPIQNTKLTYEQRVVHYKGNTSYTLAPQSLKLQLSNGTPVSLGYDNVTAPANSSATSPCKANPPILSSATNPPTANPCVNGFLQYTRVAPMRTLFPTEEFRFQSTSLKRLHLNGRLSYTGASMNQPGYFEYFNGLLSRTTLQAFTITGFAKAQRINVGADMGAVLELSDKLSISEQFSHVDFRQSGLNNTSEVDQSGTSMLNTPGAAKPAVLATNTTALGQKTDTNSLVAMYELSPQVSLSVGYRYRARTLRVTQAGDEPYELKIKENGGLFNIDLRPTARLRLNGAFEGNYADNAYVQINPRQSYQYKLRANYKPRDWAVLSAAYNDIERHDNVALVNHLDHNRSFSMGATVNPNEYYGFDVTYGYTDVYTQTTECYYSTVTGVPVPAGTACGSNTLLSNYYYDAPTQFGSVSAALAFSKRVRSNWGFRVSGVNGNTVYDNPRQVPGALQSQYLSPFASVTWTVHPGWMWKGDWNYYGYGEDGPSGPTLPRAFHANVVTIAMHYEF
jgi:hypothetical protein